MSTLTAEEEVMPPEEKEVQNGHVLLAEVLREIRELSNKVADMAGSHVAMDRKLVDHIDTEEEWQQTFLSKLEESNSAFPAGDIEGHRRYHEELIEAMEQRKAFRRAVIEKTFAGAIWAGVVWISVSVWHAVKHAIGAE